MDHSVAVLVAAVVVTVCVAAVLLFVFTQQRQAPPGSPDADESTWGLGDLIVVALVGGTLAVTIIGADVFVWGKPGGAPELTGWTLVRGLVVQNLAWWAPRCSGSGSDMDAGCASWGGGSRTGAARYRWDSSWVCWSSWALTPCSGSRAWR